MLLFGSGDLRDLVAGAVGVRHAAELFVSIEAATTAANLVAVALLTSAGARPGAPVRRLVAALLVVALLGETFAFAAVLLMAATVLVNLSPPNPYFAATLKVWEQGHFLNFNGLTRLVSAAWPFGPLGYPGFLCPRRRG